jgi:hypothetical protein
VDALYGRYDFVRRTVKRVSINVLVSEGSHAEMSDRRHGRESNCSHLFRETLPAAARALSACRSRSLHALIVRGCNLPKRLALRRIWKEIAVGEGKSWRKIELTSVQEFVKAMASNVIQKWGQIA